MAESKFAGIFQAGSARSRPNQSRDPEPEAPSRLRQLAPNGLRRCRHGQ